MIKTSSFCAGLLLLLAAGSMSRAGAQSATDTAASAPDKSDYTLFDPAPDDQMRSFCTDRPPKANLPCTVDAGHLQYESDLLNWTGSQTGGVTTNTWLFTNPTLKLGLTNRIDLELNMAPVETVTSRSALAKQSLTGIGDLFVRTKVNLAGPEGGDFQLAIIPYVKIPTARPGIGNGAVEGGMIVPVSFALPWDFTLLFDPEIDLLRNAANNGRHANYQMLGNLSHALSGSVTGYVELWGQADNDPASPTKQASLDLSVSWIAWPNRPNLQFDTGVNIGLTSATPRLQAYIGISQRF
ncbi:MAG: transporter [Acetobacteraceae bacterium]